MSDPSTEGTPQRFAGRAVCQYCGGEILDNAVVYVRTNRMQWEYRHESHGPFRLGTANADHGPFNHTPRCNSGGCHD